MKKSLSVEATIYLLHPGINPQYACTGGEKSGGEAVVREAGGGEELVFDGVAGAGVDDVAVFFAADGAETTSISGGGEGLIGDGETMERGIELAGITARNLLLAGGP